MKKLFFTLLTIGTIISCSNPTNTKNEDKNKIILADNAVALTENEVDNISDITDSTITLTKKIGKIKVGTILAGGISNKTPFGFLRKVTGVSQDGLNLTTAPAALNEYLKEGKIEIKTSMFDKRLNKLNLSKNATVQSVAGDLFSYQYTLNNFVVYDMDGDKYTTQDQIRISGSFLFSAGIDATVDIYPAEISMIGEAHTELNLGVEAELNKPDINNEKRIGEAIKLTPVVITPGIWITPVLEAFAGVKGYIYANANVAIEDKLDLNGRLHYFEGWDTPVTSVSNEFIFVELNANLDSELRGYVKAKLSFVIMELIGPSVSASPYLEAQVRVHQEPWWKLYVGSEGALGIKMGSLFFFLDDYEVPIIDNSFLLAQAALNNPPNAVTVSEPANGESNVPVNKTFLWQAVSDPDGDPVTYDLLLGTQQPLRKIAENLTQTSFTPSNPLEYETTYYYQINSKDNQGNVTESDIWQFTTTNDSSPEYGTMTDQDGNVYKTVKIGNQWWMAENLKVTHYRNGDPIPNVKDDTEWSDLSTGAYCAYDNDNGNVATYGLLYNWYAVDDSRNIAPAGWHVPSDEEWKELELFLGMEPSILDLLQWRGKDEGTKLKSIEGWLYANGNGTNESGFNAFPSGYRYRLSGGFWADQELAYYWLSDLTEDNFPWTRTLSCRESGIARSFAGMNYGYSIRLIKDK